MRFQKKLFEIQFTISDKFENFSNIKLNILKERQYQEKRYYKMESKLL